MRALQFGSRVVCQSGARCSTINPTSGLCGLWPAQLSSSTSKQHSPLACCCHQRQHAGAAAMHARLHTSQRHAATAADAPTQHHQQPAASQHKHPRFYAPQLPPSAGLSIELEPEEAKHAVRVLRLQPGDPVELCDGRGGLVQCEVSATTKSSAMLTATAEPQYQLWQGPQWVVAAACLTLKGGRTDWLVEKATELGAHSLLPLITARSATGTNKDKFKALAHKAGAAGGGGASQKKRQRGGSMAAEVEHGSSGSESDGFQASRLERLAVAATKQSLRTHGLQVQSAVSLEQLLPQLQAAPVSLVAMTGAPPILQVLQEQWQQQQQQQQSRPQSAAKSEPQTSSSSLHAWHGQPCYILIGPEGDFTPDEVQQLSDAGVLPVGLGPHRLRTETAAVAALSAAVLMSDSLGA